MISNIGARNQQYLSSLERIQNQMQTAEEQLTSGLRVRKPSDDPSAVAEILHLKSAIHQNEQIQSNLDAVTTELNTADTSLQSGISVLQSALSLAAQGASSTTSADTRANLAGQV